MTDRAKLLIHPIRTRIVHILLEGPATTKQLCKRMPHIPASSIYRSIKKLLDGSAIQATDFRTVNGIVEKLYALKGKPALTSGEYQSMTREELIDNLMRFQNYVLSDFSDAAQGKTPSDFSREGAGFASWSVRADQETFRKLREDLDHKIRKMNQQNPGLPEWKLSAVFHPLNNESNK